MPLLKRLEKLRPKLVPPGLVSTQIHEPQGLFLHVSEPVNTGTKRYNLDFSVAHNV